MATLPGMQGEVFYGDVDRPLPDWRANLPEVDSDEPTLEEMDAAVSMLGFDPSEELRRMEEQEQEVIEVPKQKTKKLVNRLPIVKKEGRWITLNGDSEDGAGTHVYVSNGKVVAGPSSLEGKPLSNLDGKKPKTESSKPAAKIPPKPKPATKPNVKPQEPSREQQQQQDQEKPVQKPYDYSGVTENESVKQELTKIQSTMGLSRNQLYASIGVLPGECKVRLKLAREDDDAYVIDASVNHSDYSSLRMVYSDYVYNSSLNVLKTGQGIGLDVFALQVKTLSANPKMKYIETTAGGDGDGTMDKKKGGGDMNGYYTWPRLGYDAKLSYASRLSKPPQIHKLYEALEKAGIDPKSIEKVSDLMKTKEGREAWYRYGFEMEMKFDLAEGSLSRKILAEYIKESKAKHGTKMLTRLKSNDDGIDDGSNDVEQPPEVQDSVLDSIWDRIGDKSDEVEATKKLVSRLPKKKF